MMIFSRNHFCGTQLPVSWLGNHIYTVVAAMASILWCRHGCGSEPRKFITYWRHRPAVYVKKGAVNGLNWWLSSLCAGWFIDAIWCEAVMSLNGCDEDETIRILAGRPTMVAAMADMISNRVGSGEKVPSELKRAIMQGITDKKLTQAQLAQEYESGKAIPNQQIIAYLAKP
ncbi:hypothetical protein Tco_0874700 [Tanacetum coccineum]|uniref:Uncharacterized protein n=1 Tax=Tanacetum coccineum TaxID=301880 RepID=A0ABQ5BP27_9ASTR